MIFKQKYWHELFEVGILLKALNSVWETALGIFLLAGGHSLFHHPLVFLNHLSHSTRMFAGVYLLAHGLLNVFLAYNLFRNRLWAYPFAMAVVLVFLVYQIYRLFHTHSPVLLGISIFDGIFIVLTWHEYTYQKNIKHNVTI